MNLPVSQEATDHAQLWWNSTDGLRTAEFTNLAEAFDRFGTTIREQERERCAKVAEEHMPIVQCMSVEPVVIACMHIATAIREGSAA